ncbi:MAG: hypothetical protein R2856_11935 [Caldilineaceae bacterium]
MGLRRAGIGLLGRSFEVSKALESDSYVRQKRDLLEKYGLSVGPSAITWWARR